MKKIFMFATAAALALGMAACSNDPADGGKTGGAAEGTAQMGLTFTLPSGAFSRAETRADQPAKAPNETTINEVAVWIFQDGQAVTDIEQTLAASVGDGGFFSFEDDDFTVNGLVYTLTDGNAMTSASGEVTIYVGVNVPTALAKAYATPGALLATFDDVADLDNDANFAMFSEATTWTLTENDPTKTDAENANANLVKVNVGRVVSRVQATKTAASYPTTWTNGTTTDLTDDVTLTYTIDGYNVYNEAIDTWMVKQATTKSTLNTFDASYTKGGAVGANATVPEYTGAAPDQALADLASGLYYIGENFTTKDGTTDPSLQGEATFVMIATKVALDHTAVWNDTKKGVEYIGDANAAADDLVIIYDGEYTYVALEDNVQAIVDGIAAYDAARGAELTQLTYPEGYVHFQKWLNKAGSNNYNVGRNEFIHVRITGIAALDGKFPGWPGTPDDPKKPDDEIPTKPIVTPDEPVDPLPADLLVEITINPWTYMDNTTVLGQ